ADVLGDLTQQLIEQVEAAVYVTDRVSAVPGRANRSVVAIVRPSAAQLLPRHLADWRSKIRGAPAPAAIVPNTKIEGLLHNGAGRRRKQLEERRLTLRRENSPMATDPLKVGECWAYCSWRRLFSP